MLREFRLLALAGEVADTAAPLRLAELVTILGRQYASSRDRRDEEVDAAVARGEDWIDQELELPDTAAVAVRNLQALMDEADDYCRQAMLLTLPRPALLRRFSDWYLGEFVGQVGGRAPRPWDGALHL